jgi:hypothetical protein
MSEKEEWVMHITLDMITEEFIATNYQHTVWLGDDYLSMCGILGDDPILEKVIELKNKMKREGFDFKMKKTSESIPPMEKEVV